MAKISNILLARQPILKIDQTVFAYELLFRSTRKTNVAGVVDGDQATTQVMINAFADIGLDSIVGDHRAFINITRNFLCGENPIPLPPEKVVLEILEDIHLDGDSIKSVKSMRNQGYQFALDDVISLTRITPVFKYIRYVKIDMLDIDRKEISPILAMLKANGIAAIAEKIETQEDFRYCANLGFDLFQGYFFCRPNIVEGKRLETSRLILLQSLASLQDPKVDYSDLEHIIAQDTSLGYKLLNLVNSAHYGLPVEVKSLRQAISLIGISYLRGWMSLLLMASVDNKPHELTRIALVRARMAELIAKHIGVKQPEQYFLVGLFSVLDALMDIPMNQVLEFLHLNPDIYDALLYKKGRMGKILRMIIDFEHGDMEDILATKLLPEIINEIYLNTISWTNRLQSGLNGKYA